MAFRDQVSSIVQEILADSTQWPAEMSYAIPQLVAQSPVSAAVVAGDLIDSDTHTSPVSSSGTTFAAGADILTNPLTFTAQGNNSYLLQVCAEAWSNSTLGDLCVLHINLDSADGGIFAAFTSATAGAAAPLSVSGVVVTPANGSHTINARLRVSGGGTATINGGAGGAATNVPIFVALYRI